MRVCSCVSVFESVVYSVVHWVCKPPLAGSRQVTTLGKFSRILSQPINQSVIFIDSR